MEGTDLILLFGAMNKGLYNPFTDKVPYINATDEGDYGTEERIEIPIPGTLRHIMVEFDWYYHCKVDKTAEGGPITESENKEIEDLKVFIEDEIGDFNQVTVSKELQIKIEEFLKDIISWG